MPLAAPQSVPYGSWKSPITSDLIVQGSINLSQPWLDGDATYWIEGRPLERGRSVIVRRAADGTTSDVTPADCNSRTKVHEYGGGDYTVAGGVVYSANFADQHLLQIADGRATPLVAVKGHRFADLTFDPHRRRVLAVREDHTAGGHEPVNTLVGVAADGSGQQVLASGHNFYSSPALSPDGRRLAWLAWNHPNMPWDGCELWLADVAADGSLQHAAVIAGSANESIFQPQWSPDGELFFVAEPTGWWNLYRWRNSRAEPLAPLAAEFGAPQWVFGLSTYACLGGGKLLCTYRTQDGTKFAVCHADSQQLERLDVPFTDIRYVRAAGSRAVFLAGSPTQPSAVVQLDLVSRRTTVLRRSTELQLDAGYLSVPQAIEFPTENGRTAHGFFYAPRNRDFTAPAGELPPLLVKSHGGPTSATAPTLNLGIQFWTSRGIGVLDVNYGGSTGYGRAYRQRLDGQWGVVDVDDCANGAKHLVAQGRADGRRLMITGGSAGGYTTLCAVTFRSVFRAGASHYGISDAAILAKETHKFESRYLDRLIGPYPQRADLYRERSPIHFAERIGCPVIFFQGLEDEVVPPNQAEMLFRALKERGIVVAYVPFAGEQHGFRQAANIKRALDGELYFYSRVFGFRLADAVEPLAIENLPA